VKYLYYKLYKSICQIKSNDSPAFTAMCLISVFQFMNFALVAILIMHINKIHLYGTSYNARIIGVSFGLIIFCLNYFLLLRKHSAICKKYSKESKKASKNGYVILFMYVAGTLISLFTLGPLLN